MPNIGDFITSGVVFGWCFCFIWHLVIGAIFGVFEKLEEVAD